MLFFYETKTKKQGKKKKLERKNTRKENTKKNEIVKRGSERN